MTPDLMDAGSERLRQHRTESGGRSPSMARPVVAGEVDAMVSVLGAALPQVTGGTVVPVAIVGPHRVKELPNVPTLKEAGIDAPLMPSWYALVGPAGMDPKVVTRLRTAPAPRILRRGEPRWRAAPRGSRRGPRPGRGATWRDARGRRAAGARGGR